VTFVDPKRGNVRGTVTLVEFGDYQCRYCGDMEAVLNAALRAHPNVVLVWKDLPNENIHRESVPAAVAARCAGRQGKFWEYHDLLFANQGDLGKDLYPRLAEELGLNVGRFTACLEGNDELPVIRRNIEEAIALGVDGTPYFFLGGVRLSGQISAKELEAALEAADTTGAR
jgi:protein-disulfide isomerase